MTTVTLTASGGRLIAKTPFANTNFNSRARAMAGHWDAIAGGWVFDARNEALVRAALRRSYGTDGTTPADTVSVQMSVAKSQWQGPVEVAGRVIARAFGRDSGAKLGQGIVLVSGSAHSGGSVKNWTTIVDAVILMHDVPRKVAERMLANGYTGVTEAEVYDPAAALAAMADLDD